MWVCPTGPRRYTCEVCGRSYRQQSSLCDHRKVHRGLGQCRLCGKVFSKPANLKAHVISQHGAAQCRPAGPVTTGWPRAPATGAQLTRPG